MWLRSSTPTSTGRGAAARGRDAPDAAATVGQRRLRIAHFFLESVAQGDLTRIRHRPTWANGRPAVTIEVRADDGTWIPHGVSLLEIEGTQIVGIDALLDPALLPRFGVPLRR